MRHKTDHMHGQEKWPEWLQKDLEDVENLNTRRGMLYYRKLYRQTPAWANLPAIAKMYRDAKRKRKKGFDVVVDHIVPLSSPYVTGLHCEANLRLMTDKENLAKSNKWWPDMWEEQQAFDFPEPEPFQLTLGEIDAKKDD